MNLFKTKGMTVAALGLLSGLAATASCDDDGGLPSPGDDLCGECDTIANGGVSISGDARLDGFFAAVGDVNQAFVSVQGDFEANIRAIAQAWGYTELGAEIDADAVAGLMAFIEGEISASVEGGITVVYAPPRCSADISVAVEAQAQCEAQAGCDVEVDPGEVSVVCEGQCSGGCSGECTGNVACDASASGGIACMGSCEGTCALDVAASCDGICKGSCTANGDTQEGFEGECAGECEGTCQMTAGASCEGTCHGTCVVEDPSLMVECSGEVECRGSCDGECSGSCEGNARPPSASADCDASADCQASASAQAEANFECTPPSLEVAFAFAADLDVNARAAFEAKLNVLRVRGAAILQGFAQLRGLIDGDLDGDGSADIDPPVTRLAGEIQGLANAGITGELEIPVFRLECAIDAFGDAASALGNIASEAQGTLSAQVEFSTSLFAVLD